MCNTYVITPQVDQSQEFIEIANDFSNPLDLVREALSNAYDAEARYVEVLFDVIQDVGNDILQITIRDNGHGMDRNGMQTFFDLGNSLRREDNTKIGEKGHGTKVFFNSSSVKVVTVKEGRKLEAVLNEPFRTLHARQIPLINVTESFAAEDTPNQTEIVILGYNFNQRAMFTHERLKDYVLWFTKWGSIEDKFREVYQPPILLLKGLDRDEPEQIPLGHPFPDESRDLRALFEEHLVYANDFYCKRIIKEGSLQNRPEVRYSAIFSIEGNRIKYCSNPMIRRKGYQAPLGAYTVQERYGLWLCKDFIPVQRKNEWITNRGSEYTKFHAFINCQALRLTANRGSVDNTPFEILSDIESVARQIYAEIIEGDDWRELDWLETEVSGYRTTQKEIKDFIWRQNKVRRSNIAIYNDHILVEPRQESGVFSLFVQTSTLQPGLFPFHVLDYDTHEGIDVIVKGDTNTPIQQARLFYVEFKFRLSNDFNHSFTNLHSIICWDTDVKHDDVVTDINQESRRMQIVQPTNNDNTTKYFLDNPRSPHRIEVYVLKQYLPSKLGLEFRPRTAEDAI